MNSIERWDLSLQLDEGTKGAEILNYARYSQPVSEEEMFRRALSHFYVTFMPTRGLQELYETLRNMFEFYNEQPVIEQIALPEPASIKAKVVATVVRPEFVVDYDEE